MIGCGVRVVSILDAYGSTTVGLSGAVRGCQLIKVLLCFSIVRFGLDDLTQRLRGRRENSSVRSSIPTNSTPLREAFFNSTNPNTNCDASESFAMDLRWNGRLSY